MKKPVEISSEQENSEKIQAVIFSRDRAMQLDGVLRSLFLHCQDADQLDVSVLYRTTDDRHYAQYQQLITEYSGRVVFKKQIDFRGDLLSILNPYEVGGRAERIFLYLGRLGGVGVSLGSFAERLWRRTLRQIQRLLINTFLPNVPADTFVLFLVDDNIFVRDFYIKDALDTLKEQNNVLGFSLRLGRNTSHCYTQNRIQELPDFMELDGDITRFNWITSEGDFGYPLEVSSSIYRLKDILPLLTWLNFENPNVLEARMAFHADVFQYNSPFLGCYRNSVTFCNPVNVVQNIMPNRLKNDIQYTANGLAFRFERGERIWVESYSGFSPHGCHQEVELVFEKRNDNVS
jgi:hypothetical protein